MSVGRPRSFLQLVLLGFALVTLPLIIVTVTATLSVDRLTLQSQQTVYDSVQVTQTSRMLVEQLTDMERHVRQYQVLNDPELFTTYATAHEDLLTLTAKLASLPLNEYQQRQLTILISKEHELFAAITGQADQPSGVLPAASAKTADSMNSEEAIQEFIALNGLAQSIQAQSHEIIDRQLEEVRQAAGKTQRGLVWQALAVIPATVLVTIIFVALISRPIRQIRRAIRRLGEGDFDSEVAITGPRDLEQLGHGLDWLRLRLFELEEAKRKFLGQVSHELKTPLAAIHEGVELLAEGVVGDVNPQQREIIGILQDKNHHLKELIDNLLNFSMAHAQNTAINRLPVQLQDVLTDVATDHKPLMLAKEIELDLSVIDVQVMGDDDKLRTVIDNLLSNAVKYSPNGGVIHVSLQRQNGHAVLDVVDSGPGIETSEKDKVFEAFYQSGHNPQAYVKGNGLGLAIAREYLSAHQGMIEVVDRPTSGAHFRVTLPVG